MAGRVDLPEQYPSYRWAVMGIWLACSSSGWMAVVNLIPSQKGLFEMNPGVRRWSGAEEATGCRLLASPHHLPRSGQA